MLRRRFAILALAIAPTATAAAQPAPDKRIRQVMERPEFAHALWGMEFYDLRAKKTISGVNDDRLFVPGPRRSSSRSGRPSSC